MSMDRRGFLGGLVAAFVTAPLVAMGFRERYPTYDTSAGTVDLGPGFYSPTNFNFDARFDLAQPYENLAFPYGDGTDATITVDWFDERTYRNLKGSMHDALRDIS
jgi:hypothetical protein